jgi:hypothetical protein
MAQIIAINVYEVNGVPVKTVESLGFASASIATRPYNGSSTSLYGIIQSSVTGKEYSTVETVAQLTTLANA